MAKTHNLARKIRIALAALFFMGITLLFLDLSGVLHHWLGWMAKVQFFPAVLSLSFITVAVIAIATLVFGRVYCSVICPLGIFQDIISWFHGRTSKKSRRRFKHRKALNWLRYSVLVLFLIGCALGVISIAALIEPYSAYGRITSELFAPLYRWSNNLFAGLESHFESYTFYTSEVWFKSIASLAAAIATVALLGFLSWKWGRIWCNSICPVGSVLSILSRHSLFAPTIDLEKCRNCHSCEKVCKSSCIDSHDKKIDYSRCVVCMDCLDECSFGAIRYEFRYKKSGKADAVKSGNTAEQRTGTEAVVADKCTGTEAADNGRREFLKKGALSAGAVALAGMGLSDRMMAERRGWRGRKDAGGMNQSASVDVDTATPLKPAGAQSLRHFSDHCIACQLCVASCPNNVLQPSREGKFLMQPEMNYSRGYCRPECNKCSIICPAGAILPVSKEEKTAVSIGYAQVEFDSCIAYNGLADCGNCARHCPAGAIRLVRKNPEDTDSPRIPVVNKERCIGCGACEYNCPAKPVKAIRVHGYEVHIKR